MESIKLLPKTVFGKWSVALIVAMQIFFYIGMSLVGFYEFVPVAIYDWEISQNEALGNKQRHQHLPCFNQAQRNADRYWSTGEAFHVRDDDFLKFAMESGGFEKMSELRRQRMVRDESQWNKPIYQGEGLGSLNQKARLAWKSFGRRDRLSIETAELASHPKITDSIDKFID
ncbi:hypothetical protein ACFLZP_01950 [Patescibacteria group bacterium]